MAYKNLIKISLLFLGLFFAKSSLAYSFVTSTPANCGTDAYSQTCVGGLKICGINPGNNVVNCADPATLNPPATSNPVESGTSNATGGYMVDCYAYDSAAPYCNNNGQYVCYQKDSCNTAGRTTVCSFSNWTTKSSDCGSCKSTHYDCDASASYDCRYKTAIANCTTYDYCSGGPGVTLCTACAAGYSLISNGCYTSIKLAADSVQSDRLRNSTSANPFMTIISTGFVGIATNTPSTFLHVNGGTGQTVNMGGGRIGGLDLMPLSGDEAVPLAYLQANYSSSSTALWGGSLGGNIWNANSGNVGIGTNNPGSKLDIEGNILVRGTNRLSFGGYMTLQSPTTSGGSWRRGFIGSNLYWNETAGNWQSNAAGGGDVAGISFNNAGTVSIVARNGFTQPRTFTTAEVDAMANMIFNTNGNVSIPTGVLTVAGTSTSAIGIGTTNPANALHIKTNTSFPSLRIEAPNFAGFQIVSGVNEWHNSVDSAGQYYFWNVQDAKRHFVVNKGGNIGIGTSTPNTVLKIVGSGQIVNVSGNRIGGLDLTPLNNDEAVPLGYLQANYSPTSGSLWGGTKNGNIYNGDSGAGNVGIGTTTPASKFQVYGTTGRLAIFGSVGDSTAIANPVNVSFGSTYGNSAPGSVNNLKWDLFTSASSGSRYGIGMSSNLMEFQSGPSGGLGFFVNQGTEAMRILSNGAVGIGTTTPGAKLHIAASTTGTKLIIDDSYTANGKWGLAVGIPSVNDTTFRLRHESSNLDVLSALTNGNIGIGTTAPISSNGGLDISSGGIGLVIGAENVSNTRTNSTIKYGRIFSPHYTNAEEPMVGVVMSGQSTSNLLSIGGGTSIGNAATHITFYTAANNTTLTGTERMRIDNGGNVGIGTTTPSVKLQVSGGTGSVINITGGSISGLDLTPLTDDQAVPLGYLKANYLDNTTSGIGKFVGLSANEYDGINSAAGAGYEVANDICSAEYAGSHVCAAYEILNTIVSKQANFLPNDSSSWVFNGPPGYTWTANDCLGRNNNQVANYGTVWVVPPSGGKGYGSLDFCNSNRKLACCK